MEHVNTILLMGRPGSGKGTQTKLLSEELKWMRASTGDRMKEIRDGNEPFSPRVREMYDKGIYLPNWFADYLLEGALLGIDSHVGIVLEGFGRTVEQAEHLVEIVSWLGRKLVIFNLEVSEEEVLRRMLKRAETVDRPDSSDEEKVRGRLRQYDENTAPAVRYFREFGLVVDIDGEKSPAEIAQEIEKALEG